MVFKEKKDIKAIKEILYEIIDAIEDGSVVLGHVRTMIHSLEEEVVVGSESPTKIIINND